MMTRNSGMGVSDCCCAPVRVANSGGCTHWLECGKCGQPCDAVTEKTWRRLDSRRRRDRMHDDEQREP